MGNVQRRWRLHCLKCRFSSHSLVETQEHLVREHGLREERIREQIREEILPDALYRWQSPQGDLWMAAQAVVGESELELV